MTDKRVVMPEGMLEAAMESRKQIPGQVAVGGDVSPSARSRPFVPA